MGAPSKSDRLAGPSEMPIKVEEPTSAETRWLWDKRYDSNNPLYLSGRKDPKAQADRTQKGTDFDPVLVAHTATRVRLALPEPLWLLNSA
ncbi:unnamed protein product [Macrosiphum euphorbiae]|uniref:Uncharacterized protein n=1 Tax=Macrosiphum euphorbiae TaxID=13131 RepID=A0AAV0Y9N9_9HEMI|nr:unnamed protein product [Macrosiphum euphorbiae]